MRRSGSESAAESDLDEQQEPPLQLAALTGKQEILMRFSEVNQFGLPRSVEEVRRRDAIANGRGGSKHISFRWS